MAKNNFDYKKWTIFVIIIGIAARFVLASMYTVAGDACWHFSVSRFIAENGKIPLFEPFGRDEPFWAPPLFHIMAAFMYKAFGIFSSAEFGMKMLSPLFGSLTLIFVYFINKKLFGEKITFYSMLFTTFIPIFMDYHIFGYIDGAITFFAVLSIYFALCDRYIKSSIAAGFAALTKYNGIFVLPLLIYIAYKNTKNKKLLIKKSAVILLVPILIASPWFVRNYINFGNPFWPLLNFIFHGSETSAFESADLQSFKLQNIININSIMFTYLAIFGVPDGNFANIFFFNIPYLEILFTIWFLGTLLFILPFVKCFSTNNKTKRLLSIWILSYVAILILYIGNVGWTATRFFLPAIPALGMLYGIGFSGISFRDKKIKVFRIIIFAIIIGFIVTEAVKLTLATREWKLYKDDFEWMKKNTKKDDIIIPGRHCLSYHLNRGTLNPKIENLKKADYIWVNLNFNLERRAIVPNEILKLAKENNYEKVYENKKTGTSICKVKQ